MAEQDRESVLALDDRASPTVVGDVGISVAVLDQTGIIVAVNQVWIDFCRDNGGHLDTCGPGASYLDACAAGGDEASFRVAEAIREAARGDVLRASRLQMSCHAPTHQRWFDVVISSALAPDARTICGATVVLAPAAASREPAVDVTASWAQLTAELRHGVVREVYGSTLSICSVLDRVTDPVALDRIRQGVETLDHTLARLRHIAVELEHP